MNAEGASTFDELDLAEISAVEKSPAYLELRAIVERALAKLVPEVSIQDIVDKAVTKDHDDAEAIANAPTIAEAIARLRTFVPSQEVRIASSRVIAALAAHPDPNATSHMIEALHKDENRAVASVLVGALEERGGAEDALLSVWIDHHDPLLRDHARVRALGRRDLDERLAALAGVAWVDNHSAIVAALFATDPDGAPARATKLLEGDVRERPGALETLRWIARHFYAHPEARSPAWEEWLRVVDRSQPWSPTPYDLYDQLRRSVVGVMAIWKMPEALATLTEHFEDFGVNRACELLEELGDGAAVVTLADRLAKAKRKPDRKRIEQSIVSLGGAPPAPEATAKKKKPKKT